MARIKIVAFIIIFIFVCLGLALINLTLFQGEKFKELSRKNSIRLLPQSGARGRILDRQGSIIVGNSLSYDALILPQESQEGSRLLKNLSGILGIGQEEIKKRLKNGYTTSFTPVTIARNIDAKKAIALEELKIDFNGIVIQPNPLREYPYGSCASHVLGYLGEIDRWRLTKLEDYGYKTKDIVGFGGIEEKYDYYLRQEEGGLLVEVDHRGRLVRVLGFRPPRNGKDIQLTIDLDLQKIAEDSLRQRKGSVILMDPQSGEVLAMASSPNFNPAMFISESKDSLQGLFNNPDGPFINRAISGVYPAGSVFKIVVALAALENNKITPYTTFFCPGFFKIGNQRFACWDTHKAQNLLMGIAHSCNVFFYRTGILTGAQVLHDYAVKFGLSKPTAIDLPYESSGFVPSPLWKRISRFQSWFDGDTANLSIGQGDLLVTPIQLTRTMAAFANGGRLVTPYITKAIDGRAVLEYSRKITSPAIKQSSLNYIREGLRRVVADSAGTANMLASLPVAVAGKTGTVQVPRGQAHAWFVGFFPFEKPKFVVCVFLEHGGAGHAAATLAKQILEAMFERGYLK